MTTSTTNPEALNRKSLYLRLIALLALSCLFSWWQAGINLWLDGHVGSMIFPLGPLLAAVLLIRVTEGREGLAEWGRRMRVVRGPVRIYAAAILLPAIIPLATAGVAVLGGVEMPPASRWLSNILSAVAFIIPMALIGGPIGEELAFRGWGQYRLQQVISPFTAALVIGAGVIVWHLPLLLTGSIPWTTVIALPAVSVVYAWVYRQSGSIWPAVAVHTFHNVVGGEYIGSVFEGEAAALRMGLVAAVYVAWAAYIVLRYGTSLTGRDKAPVAPTAVVSDRVVAEGA